MRTILILLFLCLPAWGYDLCTVAATANQTYYAQVTMLRGATNRSTNVDGDFYKTSTNTWVSTNAVSNAATEKGGSVKMAVYCVTLSDSQVATGDLMQMMLRDSATSSGAIVGTRKICLGCTADECQSLGASSY